MAADETTRLIEKSMELCVASRTLIECSKTLIEISFEAIESSWALLARPASRMGDGQQTIAQYIVHFLDHGARVFETIVPDRDADSAAIAEAHSQNVPSIGAGCDVRRGDRLVHQHRR